MYFIGDNKRSNCSLSLKAITSHRIPMYRHLWREYFGRIKEKLIPKDSAI
jgi:hypothetical protein